MREDGGGYELTLARCDDSGASRGSGDLCGGAPRIEGDEHASRAVDELARASTDRLALARRASSRTSRVIRAGSNGLRMT